MRVVFSTEAVALGVGFDVKSRMIGVAREHQLEQLVEKQGLGSKKI